MRVQVMPSVLSLLQNSNEVRLIRTRLNAICTYTSAHGIGNARAASFIEETKRKGLFYIENGKWLIMFCFLGDTNQIEEMCVFDLLEVGTYHANCLKREGVYKHLILTFKDDVVTNY